MQQKDVFKNFSHSDTSFSFRFYPGLVIIFKSSSEIWHGFHKEKIAPDTIRKEIESLIKNFPDKKVYEKTIILIGPTTMVKILLLFLRGRGFSHIQFQYRSEPFIIRKQKDSAKLEISKDQQASWQTAASYEKYEVQSKGFLVLGASDKPDATAKIESCFQEGNIKLLKVCANDAQIRQSIVDHMIDSMVIEASFATQRPHLIKDVIAKYKIPVLIVFSIHDSNISDIFQLLHLGAFDYVSLDKENQKLLASEVLDKLKFAFDQTIKTQKKSTKPATIKIEKIQEDKLKNKIIGIGASTGGPIAIKTLLSAIKKPHPPIVIAQHILSAYAEGFANWIKMEAELATSLASIGDILQCDHVYVLPADGSIHLKKEKNDMRFATFKADEKRIFTPCIDDLFSSMSAYKEHIGAVILLTGMGSDGANGLLKCKQAGIPTFVQDEESCVIFGMPKEAIALGAADAVLPIDQMMFRVIEKIVRG